MKHLRSFVFLALVACGGSAGSARAPSTTVTSATPRNLEEGMRAVGLAKVELAKVEREATHSLAEPPRVEGREVVMSLAAGWSARAPVFARGAGNKIYLVEPHPNVIVDRHVDGGCQGFLGGRMWTTTAVFALPPGTTWGGTHVVTWEEHTEVVDHRTTERDGSPCPPPAID